MYRLYVNNLFEEAKKKRKRNHVITEHGLVVNRKYNL